MNSLVRSNPELLYEMYSAGKMQAVCAARLLKDLKGSEEPLCNIALYHLSMWMKIMLKIVCLRFSIEYDDRDSIEVLFQKANSFLPTHILEMVTDICYWHYEVQYKNEDVKTVDDVCEIAHTIECYNNDKILHYAQEMHDSLKNTGIRLKPITALNKF